jgi:ketosteroid isomerase-like protein
MPPTQADVECVVAAYAEFNARFQQLKEGDISGLDRFCAEDMVLVPVDGWPVSGRYEGYDGYRTWMREVFAGTAENRYEEIETTVVGDYVVATMMSRGRAEDDPIEMEAPIGAVHALRDGRITGVWVYLGHERALQAAADGPPA